MANRHTNKKLRRVVRNRMSATGETYQKALAAVLQGEAGPRCHCRSRSRCRAPVDLVVAHYFGLPVTFAVFEASEPVGHPVILRLPSARDFAVGARMPLPLLNYRLGGVE